MTATTGKYIVTHGNGGKFGQEFSAEYADVLINSMSYNDIVENVKYNSSKACYNHTVSTLESFSQNCAQLGLGMYLRDCSEELVSVVRKYLPDNMIVITKDTIPTSPSVRKTFGFKGIVTAYVSGDYGTIANLSYLRNVAAKDGAPFHILVNGDVIEYMIEQGTLVEIVSTLRNEGIYLGACYASTATLEQLTAVGGCGHAASECQCNSFSGASVGSWSPLDLDLSGWTIPSDITGISDGKLVNSTNEDLVVITPSTGVFSVSKGQVQARVNGNVTFGFGGIGSQKATAIYEDYNEDKPINCSLAGLDTDMQLTVTIGANSSVEFLDYQVTKC